MAILSRKAKKKIKKALSRPAKKSTLPNLRKKKGAGRISKKLKKGLKKLLGK